MSFEGDPNGLKPHEPGAKFDDGKVDMTLLLDWPLALAAVCQVSELGARKYSRGGWKHVPDGFARYTAAMLRHLFGLAKDDGIDHDAQVAWNALSRLELKLAAKAADNHSGKGL